MFEEDRGFSCALGCWALAAGAAILAFVLLMVLGGTGFFASAFMSAVLFAVLGLLFQAIFCSKLSAPNAQEPGGSRMLDTHIPDDPAALSVTLAAAQAEAKARGETPPTRPQDVPPVGRPGTAKAPTVAKTAAPAAAPAPAPAAAAEPAPAPAPAPEPKAEPAPAPEPAPADDAGPGVQPATMDGPRDGKADDLKKIKGVGPKLEAALNDMGYYHFDQIAAWSPDEVAWVDENLIQFKGRVTRDNWVPQAKALAEG